MDAGLGLVFGLGLGLGGFDGESLRLLKPPTTPPTIAPMSKRVTKGIQKRFLLHHARSLCGWVAVGSDRVGCQYGSLPGASWDAGCLTCQFSGEISAGGKWFSFPW